MRTLLSVALLAVLAASVSMPARGERAGARESSATATIPEAGSREAQIRAFSADDEELSVSALVHDSLGAGADLDDEGDLTEFLLRTFYAGDASEPIWVTDGKPNAKARDAAAEIARSGQYGLDPRDYELPDFENAGPGREALAKFELAMTRVLLQFANQAKAGRIHPSKVGHSQNEPEGLKDLRAFLQSLRSSDNVAAVMRDLHPKHPQFKALVKKLAELRGGSGEKPRIQLPDGPVLKLGVTHEHVALLRERLEVEAADGTDANKFDEAVDTAVKAFQKEKGLKQDGVVGNNTRHAMNGESNDQLVIRILANMERWRWLPDDLDRDAGIFIWTNIPEFRVRIVSGGEVVFNERAIVGKTDKQTPVFSDELEWIEIHPTWYVPMSIIVDDIGPSLRRPTSTLMKRYHLKLNCGSHGTDWKSINWDRVNIRNCSVSQPPGEKSVLGDFKFKFPNRHDVYMHDTPQKKLFNSSVRAYSHGCMRIRNPRRMAEILLKHDKGMTPERIGAILAGPKRLHKEELTKHVPVHVTYFTVFFDEKGGMQTFRDIYGHDRRLVQALTGKGSLLPAPAIAGRKKRAPERTQTAEERVWRNVFRSN